MIGLNGNIASRFAKLAALTMSLAALGACGPEPEPPVSPGSADAEPFSPGPPADLILHNATVITLDEDLPRAEAIAVADGRILAVGESDALLAAHRRDDTTLRDLEGRVVLPGFIDAHGHFMQVGFLAQSANLLPPPDGGVDSLAALGEALEAHMDSPQARKMGWIVGVGYDDAQLAEQRHPTAADLDAVFDDRPVLIVHQSGHLAVLNSPGLEALGVSAESEDPPGGVIRRKAGSREPDGVLEENAFFVAIKNLPMPTDAGSTFELARAAQEAYLSSGFTSGQEGRAMPSDVAALRAVSEAGLLDVDVAVYPDPTFADGEAAFDALMADASPEYRDHLRIAGIKLSLDGSPQGKTAWLTKPYFVPPQGQDADYAGYPQLSDDAVQGHVKHAFEMGWQVLTHVNGDAAIDQFIAAVRAANDTLGTADRRPVAIHAQTAREDQLDAMAELGIIPSFMSVHTFYWGDWHRDSVLGPERAARISPARSALDRGMIYTSHNDAPVTPPNSQMILYSQVNRLTRSGQVLGPEQRVSAHEALKAITLNAAHQHFEEDRKGSIEAGKLADLVVVDRDPLAIEGEALLELEVLETIKEGQTVWSADG